MIKIAIEINPKNLKEKLIEIYSYYLSDDEKIREKAYKKAMDIDGLWSGDFLFEPEVTLAIRSLRYLYIKPKISKEEAKKILEGLKNAKF